jgi:hypothetical protein
MKKIFNSSFKIGAVALGVISAVFLWKKNISKTSTEEVTSNGQGTVSGLREWNSALSREIVRSHRDARDVCIAVVNVQSSVKTKDDSWLREVETEFIKSVRGSDLLSHDDKGEFYLLFPEAGLDEGYEAIERMKGCLPDNTMINASVAVWDHCETASELVARSIKALSADQNTASAKIVVSEAPQETQVVS